MYMGIMIVLIIICFVFIILASAKAHQKAIIIAIKRYEDAKSGKLNENDLTEQERNLLNTFREDHQDCGQVDINNLLLWSIIMAEHRHLPRKISQSYELEIKEFSPDLYETYQNYYEVYQDNYANNSQYYDSSASYASYSSYSSY